MKKNKKEIKKLEVEGVIFDIGNTLINASQLMDDTLNKVVQLFHSLGKIQDPNKFIEVYKKVDSSIQGPRINHLFSDVQIVRETIQNIDYNFDKTFVGMFFSEYRKVLRKKLKKNIKLVHLFQWLKNSGFKTGIITDGTRNEQTEQLASLGIIEYIDETVTSEDCEIEKPAQKIFHTVLTQLNLQPDKSVMVGDDLIRDIKGAKDVGMYTALVLWYTQKQQKPFQIEPDLILHEPSDIKKFIVRDQNE